MTTPSNSDRTPIGIIGLGHVGSAVQNWFERFPERYSVYLFDPYKHIGSLDEVNGAEIVFIAVPTPFSAEKGGYDDGAIRESLAGLTGSKTVVVKSTMLPGTTEALAHAYPNHKILCSPEFLRTKTAVEDFAHPERELVGYTAESKDEADRILAILPPAPFHKTMPASEAEMAKLFGNVFLANKVVFANQMYDICTKLGIDYEAVRAAVAADSRIGESHLAVAPDGNRGYGGPCFPKDVKALRAFAEHLGLEPKLVQAMEEVNADLRGDETPA